MRKAQYGNMLTVVVMALLIPLVITLFYLVQVTTTNATEGSLTIAVTDEAFTSGNNNTATSTGNNYMFEDDGVTFNTTGLTEDTNYTVDYDTGTITFIDNVGNNTAYLIDYAYFVDSNRLTFNSISGNTNDSYDLAGILPIALIGIAVLVAILSAIGGLVVLRR